jgi:hypothetical protein
VHELPVNNGLCSTTGPHFDPAAYKGGVLGELSQRHGDLPNDPSTCLSFTDDSLPLYTAADTNGNPTTIIGTACTD